MTGIRTSTPELRRTDELLILDLGDDGNLFDAERLAAINALLDEVEQSPPPCALVTTSSGRHWCDGVNLSWMFDLDEQCLHSFVRGMLRLYARFLALPVVSVAAIQGHAFANGVMLALSHDYRVMESGRGYLCLPNADAGYPVTLGELTLLRAKLPPSLVLQMITTGKRYDAKVAAASGLVDVATSDEPAFANALSFARPLAHKDRTVIEGTKRLLFDEAISVLCGPRAAVHLR
ncbi:enoyl-CoA hydratase/isomerase family protein [Frankia sp. Cpl3]|nr:enoyl-CoA hydratase/isomerase family protein [Frankia sp. Cpl3]